MRHAPGPLLALGVGLCTVAFATEQPLIMAALVVGALALHVAAAHRRRMYLTVGLLVAITMTLLNPFVQANGDLILLELPDIPIFDMQVTFEEVMAGAALGARAFVVTVIIGALLAHADPDRLLNAAGRLLPRSALTASIAARMLPTLERDAHALTEMVTLRGRSLRTGPRRTRARAAGTLALPLVGSALERSLDVAEAMAARGYGAGPRTHLPTPTTTRAERVIWLMALPLAALAVLVLSGRLGGYSYYPTMDTVLATDAIIVAVGALAAACGAAWAARS
jgi:energy-coupling factor transport system permease protein